jgi:hypothetical protein
MFSSTTNQVIYDINKQGYHYFNGDLVVPIILLIIIIGTFFFIVESYKTKKKQSVYRGIIFMIFIGYFFKIFGMLYLYEYQRTNSLKLKVNESQEVVGNIKNFIPLSQNRKQPCSFEINGVKFQFSPTARTGAFTYTSYPLHNGQKVKIKYVYDANWKMNLIFKFEIIDQNQ